MSANSCCSPVEDKVEDVKTKTIREFYDSVAEGMGPYENKTDKFSPSGPTDWIVNKIKSSPNHTRIMDIGCGMGTTILRLVNEFTEGTKFIGLDFSTKMIERANYSKDQLDPALKKKVGFFSADVQALPYMDDQFDFIYSECVFNLVPDRDKAMAEVERVLAPGGILVYTDFASYTDVPESIKENLTLVSGCRAGSIKLQENIDYLKKHGFAEVETVDFTEDKNKRYEELRESSEEIMETYVSFQNEHPEAARFLEDEIGYYVFVAKKGDKGSSCCS